MNKESKKLTWAVGLVAGLGVLSIAYAALSSTLNINGENASVNVGYVRFLGSSGESDASGELEKNTKGCQPWGIGSTNTEYIKSTNSEGTESEGTNSESTKSGGIFNGRANGNTGLIIGDELSANLTKALAEPGTFSLGATNKAKDTVTIENAKLNDYGSFIVYRLDIVNESNNDMRLKTLPEIKLKDLKAVSGQAASDSKIERVIYTDCDTKNFVTPCTMALTAADNGSGSYDASKKTEYNYLKAGGKTTWYLRIGFSNYDQGTNNISGRTTFGFSVIPQWEAVMA